LNVALSINVKYRKEFSQNWIIGIQTIKAFQVALYLRNNPHRKRGIRSQIIQVFELLDVGNCREHAQIARKLCILWSIEVVQYFRDVYEVAECFHLRAVAKKRGLHSREGDRSEKERNWQNTQ